MSRQVLHKAHGPAIVKVGDSEVHICRCGLSKDPNGLCDDSHVKTLKEDDRLVYIYNEKDEVVDVYNPDSCGDEDCCGGGCGDCECKKDN